MTRAGHRSLDDSKSESRYEERLLRALEQASVDEHDLCHRAALTYDPSSATRSLDVYTCALICLFYSCKEPSRCNGQNNLFHCHTKR